MTSNGPIDTDSKQNQVRQLCCQEQDAASDSDVPELAKASSVGLVSLSCEQEDSSSSNRSTSILVYKCCFVSMLLFARFSLQGRLKSGHGKSLGAKSHGMCEFAKNDASIRSLRKISGPFSAGAATGT